jgi:DNA (cytosine-5)-methyltransferase 1
LADELVVDLFAGGGGASTGIEAALGRAPDFAINHDPVAIACHAANHPQTRHFIEDVTKVSPAEVAAGRRIGLLWLSPDCTHHSKAKGKKPRDQKRRSLANVAIDWASLSDDIRPRIICLENVEEFKDWGPLDEEGHPIAERAGEDFRAWCAKLVDCGYRIAFSKLVAANYGTPTTRERLFMIARCDGGPLTFPGATHGKGCPDPWRPASEVIDWSLPCPSIFLSKEDGRILGVKRPLVDATMRRIGTGVWRHVVNAATPFIVPVSGVAAAPTLVQTGYGERKGQAPRALDLGKPLGTAMAGGVKHALVAAFLAKHYGGPNGHPTPGSSAHSPLGAVTTRDHHALAAVHITKFYGTSIGADVREPLPVVTAGGWHLGAVRAFLIKYYGQGSGQPLSDSLHTITTHDRFGLVMVRGEPYQIVDIGMRMLAPHELFKAMGFPDEYQICPTLHGKPITKTEQIRLCGNAVCPPVAEAMVRQATGRWDGRAPKALIQRGQMPLFDLGAAA